MTKDFLEPGETFAVVDEMAARRAASAYLGFQVGIAFSASDGIFIPLEQPIWQFAIRFRLPRLGLLGIMGTIDVDARTREVSPLSDLQIQQIQRRANVIAQHRTQAAAA